jgi:glucose-1-phosphate thymidylyltransferase
LAGNDSGETKVPLGDGALSGFPWGERTEGGSMNAIIPVAGVGTRLRPHTYSLPKALLRVGDKPIIGHILDKLVPLNIDRLILIIGYLGGKIKAYVSANYTFNDVQYVEQKKRNGLGHAVWMARSLAGEDPALIVYGDTIFEGDLSEALDDRVDGKIGVKQVEDPRRFGVVQMEGTRIRRLAEKPETFISDLAIVGVNYIHNTSLLFRSLDRIIEEDITTRGEYQVTDAFQLMVEEGAHLEIFPVEDWFDCGKPETLLATNRHLLSNGVVSPPVSGEHVVVIEPCFIASSARIVDSVIGPYVSIGESTVVEGCRIRDSIIGDEATVETCVLEGSLIGDNTIIHGTPQKLNIGDSAEICFGNT